MYIPCMSFDPTTHVMKLCQLATIKETLCNEVGLYCKENRVVGP